MNPAEWLGFVRVDPVADVAAHRWALALLVVAWVLATARGHRRLALALGCAWACAGPLFWCLALERPFGYGFDARATRSTAELVVAATSGRAGESALSADAIPASPAAQLAAVGVDAASLLALAALAPALAAPLLALASLAGSGSARGLLVGVALLTATTTDLDALRGTGLVSGVAYRPEAAFVLPLALATALLAARSRRGVALAALAAGAGLILASRGAGLAAPAVPPRLGVDGLTGAWIVDQGVWLVLAVLRAIGVRRGDQAEVEDRAGAGLALAGASLGLAGGAGFGPLAADPWPGFVVWRIGLLLMATGAVAPLLYALIEPWRARVRWTGSGTDLAAAALVLATAPGAFSAWWEPAALDPLYAESLAPLSTRAATAAAWIDAHAPRAAVVLCSPTYLPEVVLAGRRRVLRAPVLGQPEDAPRRERAEKAALQGRAAAPLYARYGLRYLFIGPGDFRQHGLAYPDALVGRPGLKLRHVAPGGFYIYELAPDETPAGG
jgi:hypothetical protein